MNRVTVYWDIETKGLDGEMVVVGAKREGEKRVHFFTKYSDFWEWLKEIPAKEVVLYAHNGGRFDNLDMVDFLSGRKDVERMKLIPVHSSVLLEVKADGRRFKFYDSYLIIPLPLRSFGETFHLPIAKEKFDRFDELEALDRLDEATRRELLHYLELDVRVLEEGFQKFHELLRGILHDLGIGEVYETVAEKYTIASIAFTVLREYIRHKYGRDLLRNPLTAEAEDFVRSSYAGGRTEAFRVYAERVRVYDVNSMYPSVMASGYYPVGRWEWITDRDYLRRILSSRSSRVEGFVEARVRAPEIDPPLLWKKENGHLLFPLGEWTGVYPIPELKTAVTLGYEIEPIRGIIYEERRRVFEEYVGAVYLRRKRAKIEGNKGLSLVLKLLLNSSYGKFAQHRKRVELIPLEYLNEETEVIGNFGVKEYVSYADRSINPAIASYVTAYARIRLYYYMNKYRDSLVYCDTDSIFLADGREIDPRDLGKDLGLLDFEGEYDRGYFAGAKLYLLISDGGKVKMAMKGIRKSLLKSFSLDELEDIYTDLIYQRAREFKIERLAGFREILRRKLAKENPRYRVLIEQVKKVRFTLSEKREVEDGFTRPKRVSGDETG